MDPKEDLHSHLSKLHEELAAASRVDPQSRQSMGDIMRDIKRLIDEPSGRSLPHDPSLPDRLEEIALRFEADHPTLAASARGFVDLLGKAGL
jgi:hypothetical protein